MKKLNKICAAIALSCAMAMPMVSQAAIVTPAKAAEAAQDGFTFKAGVIDIVMGVEAKDVLKALGNPTKKVFEIDSCAYQGKDRIYTYPGFELGTSAVNGKEIITSLVITDASVKTPEGIGFGSKKQDVIKAYGSVADRFGVYEYSKNKTQLSVYTTKGIVDGIEYYIVLQ